MKEKQKAGEEEIESEQIVIDLKVTKLCRTFFTFALFVCVLKPWDVRSLISHYVAERSCCDLIKCE